MGPEREGARARAQGESGTARAGRGDGRPGWRKRAAPRRARRGEREDPARSPGKGRGSRAQGAPVAITVAGWRWRQGTPARGLSGPTDFLTDRRRHTPLHPTPPRPHPRAGAASLSRLPRPPLLLHFFSASASFSAPAAPVPSPGPGGAPRFPAELSVESGGGTFRSSREAAPAPGERCRGSFSREDRGMRRVRPGRVAFVNTSSASRPLGC